MAVASSTGDSAWINPLRKALLDWSPLGWRDLPWRQTRDPWAILVSELMLQQTQVSRVTPRYLDFLRRFPHPEACAKAPVGAVVEAWAGLGYNKRAVHLHRAAVVIHGHFGGAVPDRLADLLALPGVGPYTARAVLVFAFERPLGVVDTNAARVLARGVAGRALTPLEAQELADRLVPPERAWAWNQAVLDLGASVCTTREPSCRRCPLAAVSRCAWHRRSTSGPDPSRGSAGVSGRQSRFEGSDRQGRGRLVGALRRAPVPLEQLASVAGWPGDPARADQAAASLVADGLAVFTDTTLQLP